MKYILASILLCGSLSAHCAPEVAATIPLAGPTRWDYASVDPQAHRLYVAHMDRVEVIDTRSHKPLFQLAPASGVHGAAAASEVNRVFTSDGAADSMGVFDLASGKRLGAVKVGGKPDAILYDRATKRVLTFNGKSHDITAVDAASLHVLSPSIPVGGVPEYAVADGEGLVYFNVEDTGEMAVLDARTLRIVRRYSLAPCEEPSGLARDPKGRLYSVCANALMVISDPAAGKVLGQAEIGHGADGVAWMDGKAYSANGQDGTMTIVTESSPGQFTAATLRTARGARTIAADPGLHELFTPTADFKAESQPAPGQRRRPEAIPDSFKILVIRDEPMKEQVAH